MSYSLSIILPTKNRPCDLLVALSSILSQMSKNDELIIIDQSDNSCESEVRQLCIDFGIQRLIYKYLPEEVQSLVQAKDMGLNLSCEQILVFLEDDIELGEHYLRNIRNAAEKYPEVMAGCGTEIGNNTSWLYIICFMFCHFGIFFDKRLIVLKSGKDTDVPVYSRFLSGGISFVRREVFYKVDFDLKNKFFALEDIDFSFRVSSYFGRKSTAIFPNIRLIHHRSNVNRALDKARWSRKTREFLVFYRKHERGLTDGFSIAWLLLWLFVFSVYESILIKKADPLLGFWSGVNLGIRQNVQR